MPDHATHTMMNRGLSFQPASSAEEVDMNESSRESADVRAAAGVWWIAALVGVLSIIAGIIVLVKPSNSLSTLAVVSGIFVLIDGIAAIVAALGRDTANRGLLATLGVLSVVVGILLIRHPIAGVTAVALLLGIWLIAAAVVRLVVAFELGEHRLRHLTVAVILAIVGIAIVSSPHIGYATLALLVGLGFVGYGAAMIVVGLAIWTVGHVASPPAAPHRTATT
jgi:uncharacterized membrane protein HdeD (DUF308 family)